MATPIRRPGLLRQLWEVFDASDVNGDGVITLPELILAVRKYQGLKDVLGIDGITVEEYFKRVDIDSSNGLTWGELASFCVFRTCDADADGFIEKHELIDVACRHRDVATLFGIPVRKRRDKELLDELTSFFQTIDGSGNGQISWVEFREFYRRCAGSTWVPHLRGYQTFDVGYDSRPSSAPSTRKVERSAWQQALPGGAQSDLQTSARALPAGSQAGPADVPVSPSAGVHAVGLPTGWDSTSGLGSSPAADLNLSIEGRSWPAPLDVTLRSPLGGPRGGEGWHSAGRSSTGEACVLLASARLSEDERASILLEASEREERHEFRAKLQAKFGDRKAELLPAILSALKQLMSMDEPHHPREYSRKFGTSTLHGVLENKGEVAKPDKYKKIDERRVWMFPWLLDLALLYMCDDAKHFEQLSHILMQIAHGRVDQQGASAKQGGAPSRFRDLRPGERVLPTQLVADAQDKLPELLSKGVEFIQDKPDDDDVDGKDTKDVRYRHVAEAMVAPTVRSDKLLRKQFKVLSVASPVCQRLQSDLCKHVCFSLGAARLLCKPKILHELYEREDLQEMICGAAPPTDDKAVIVELRPNAKEIMQRRFVQSRATLSRGKVSQLRADVRNAQGAATTRSMLQESFLSSMKHQYARGSPGATADRALPPSGTCTCRSCPCTVCSRHKCGHCRRKEEALASAADAAERPASEQQKQPHSAGPESKRGSSQNRRPEEAVVLHSKKH